ncbi:cilia- and flagella-associated protein 107 [Genypterus blacodes]|uniref:cilia- and flagella-associated protein 107 n=1 Tax=Genypterus blacodes TaxID=154954 RepID=UPI003F775071
MNQTGTKDDKWSQPGWRIEPKYANKVLIGNWKEERLQFSREPKTANSTNHIDYQPHWDFKPDVSERGSAMHRAEGLPSKLFFAHHGTPASLYLVTQYEESYGQKGKTLPTLHHWHPDRPARQPGRSNYPISAPPTNFGPLQPSKHHLEKQQSHLPSVSVYRSAYQRHPLSAFCQKRFASASCRLSSHLYAANHKYKDLDLRQRPLLQVPDHCLRLLPSSQQA